MEFTSRIAIIGAGPIGLELAVALRREGLSYVHLEAGQIGATMQWWAPGTRWFSSPERIAIAGVPLVTAQQEKATREEYLAYLRGIVLQFDLDVRAYERVLGIDRSASGFTIETEKHGQENRYHVAKVILATGGTAQPKRLNIPGEDLPHVSHYFQDPHTYFKQRLLVVGGRNSAIEAALRSHRAGAHVALSYRGDALDAKDIKFWLYPEIESLTRRGRIPAYFQTSLVEITPSHAVLQTPSNDLLHIAADFVLLMTGYQADMTLFETAGVELVSDRHIPRFHEQTMETNVPGLYVAGTAIAGSQERYHVFLENCHVHVDRIVAHLTGREPPHVSGPVSHPGRPET